MMLADVRAHVPCGTAVLDAVGVKAHHCLECPQEELRKSPPEEPNRLPEALEHTDRRVFVHGVLTGQTKCLFTLRVQTDRIVAAKVAHHATGECPFCWIRLAVPRQALIRVIGSSQAILKRGNRSARPTQRASAVEETANSLECTMTKAPRSARRDREVVQRDETMDRISHHLDVLDSMWRPNNMRCKLMEEDVVDIHHILVLECRDGRAQLGCVGLVV
mmetsp:Transcript_11971/g.30305  ORF Transcript_11971/g.30305 Transcript_11971/m.30305 type:complete len:219 (-) Transcript_11971:233-889(-)